MFSRFVHARCFKLSVFNHGPNFNAGGGGGAGGNHGAHAGPGPPPGQSCRPPWSSTNLRDHVSVIRSRRVVTQLTHMRASYICVINSVFFRNRLEKIRAMATRKISWNLSRKRCGFSARCRDGYAATGRCGTGEPKLPSHGGPTTFLCHNVIHRSSPKGANRSLAFHYSSNGSNSSLEI